MPGERHFGARRRTRYDRAYGGDQRYDRGAGYGQPSGHGLDLGRYGTPFPGAAGYPSARFGWGPVGWAGWAPGMEFWPYADAPGYGFDGRMETPRQPPRESPSYGRGGDRALQRWARRYGYDMGYEIRPRDGRQR
jgi:hypothetical protein